MVVHYIKEFKTPFNSHYISVSQSSESKQAFDLWPGIHWGYWSCWSTWKLRNITLYSKKKKHAYTLYTDDSNILVHHIFTNSPACCFGMLRDSYNFHYQVETPLIVVPIFSLQVKWNSMFYSLYRRPDFV